MATLVKKTVAPSGGDFTSLNDAVSWFETNYPNFVTSDIYGEIEITGSWSSADTAYVSIDSLTLDSTHYLHIYTDSSNRASASWNTSKYRLETGNSASSLTIKADYVRIDGLQIGRQSGAANNYACINLPSGHTFGSPNEVRLSNLIVKQAKNPTYSNYGLNITASGPMVKCWNIVFYNFDTVSFHYPVYISSSSATLYLYNCLLIGGYYGIRASSGSVTAKNCYAYGYTQAYYGTISKTTCASSDTSGSSGLQNIALADAGFVSISSGSEDFHLATPTSPLYHTGTDTSGDSAPMNFTTDIDGQNYYDTGGKRSIGVDELSGQTVIKVINE